MSYDPNKGVVFLITHEPSWAGLPGGWDATAPGYKVARTWSPWRALADAIYAWDRRGRGESAGTSYAPVGPNVVGTVADDARRVYKAHHEKLRGGPCDCTNCRLVKEVI
jgi:hypothetical protein